MSNRLRQIHWLVPATTVISLVAGILFAVGHHRFYRSLEGTTPPLAMYHVAGSQVSGQAFNLAAGTAFAFLVRSCLAFAMALSYTQLAWFAIKRSARDNTIPDIDKATGALGNFLVLMNVFAWMKWRLLLLPALLSWLLPIATVITPATLTVGQISPPPEMRDVQSVAYTSANMFTVSTISSNGSFLQTGGNWNTASYKYEGPSDAVSLIANAVGSQGGVLSVLPPAQNSTWNVSFLGPSMRCNNVSDHLRDRITLDIAQYMNESMFHNNLHKDSLVESPLNPLFLAWTPPIPSNLSAEDSSSATRVLPLNRQVNYDIANRHDGDLFPLFVAIIPSAIILTYPGKIGDLLVATRWHKDTTLPEVIDEYIDPGLLLLQCDLHNATYDVSYNFSAGIQSIDSTVTPVLATSLDFIDVAFGFTPQGQYGSLVSDSERGGSLPAPADCQGLWNASSGPKTTCDFDASVLNKFSYQAVWDAFATLVRGSMWVDVSKYQPSDQKDTVVMNTVLATSTELAPIVELVRRRAEKSLQQDLLDRYSGVPGMYSLPAKAPAQSLSSMLEDLFRNITLSLATSPELQANKSSPYKLPQSEVTFTTISPVYEYSQSRLWLAYGVAIAISALIVIAGLVVMYMGGAAYNNSFSNILRLARGAHLSHEIIDGDHDGKEPLPKYLEKSTISFAGSRLWQKKSSGEAKYDLVPTREPKVASSRNDRDPDVESGERSTRHSPTEVYDADAGPGSRSNANSQNISSNEEIRSANTPVGQPIPPVLDTHDVACSHLSASQAFQSTGSD